ncbi:zf-RVT domain-containing protein [Cephalotus follicularis]|uniref:Zf-RVT domain-containing protein n=1 Tax=Cephalotus follicularis TaxID=3775 RepID=A0A1Q3C8A6_CEPFO|nr:zf-RVT domain-containing protein [Cephalotus follicularis]
MNCCLAVLLKDCSFWAAPVTKACSWSWRNILLTRRYLIQSVLYEVRDGNSFSLWHDPWVLGDSIVNRFGERVIYDSGILRNTLTSSVIREGRWEWPTTSCDLLELNNITVAIPLPAGRDKVHWMKKGGIFSLPQAWLSLVPHSPVASWAKVVWFPKRIPKHSFCLWLTFFNGHKTLDKLHSIGVSHSDTCIFGCGQRETINHLFFSCPFIASIWNHLLTLCEHNRGSGGWDMVSAWSIQKLQGNSFKPWITKLSLAAAVYHCWVQRNNRLFRNSFCNSESVIQLIVSDVVGKCRGLDRVVDNQLNSGIFHNWNLPSSLLSAGVDTGRSWSMS